MWCDIISERWKFFFDGYNQVRRAQGTAVGNHSVWVFVAITPVTARNYHYLLPAATSPQVTEADQENTKWIFISFPLYCNVWRGENIKLSLISRPFQTLVGHFTIQCHSKPVLMY